MRLLSQPVACPRVCGTSLLVLGMILAACGSLRAQEVAAPLAQGVAAAPEAPKWGMSLGGYGMNGRITTALLPLAATTMPT